MMIDILIKMHKYRNFWWEIGFRHQSQKNSTCVTAFIRVQRQIERTFRINKYRV